MKFRKRNIFKLSLLDMKKGLSTAYIALIAIAILVVAGGGYYFFVKGSGDTNVSSGQEQIAIQKNFVDCVSEVQDNVNELIPEISGYEVVNIKEGQSGQTTSLRLSSGEEVRFSIDVDRTKNYKDASGKAVSIRVIKLSSKGDYNVAEDALRIVGLVVEVTLL